MDENTVNTSVPKQSSMKWVVIVVFILLLAGGAAFFAMQGNSGSAPAMTEGNTDNQSSEEQPSDIGAMVDESESVIGEVKTFNVSGSPFKFNLTEIRVNKGDTVRIVYTSSAGTHDWVIDEFSAKTNVLQAGQTETIEFIADQTGTFEYYCSVGNHREMGMVGNLIVE